MVIALLGCREFFVNAKNSDGFTALDVAVDSQEIRNMLCRARAKGASSLPKFSWEYYFRTLVPINEKCIENSH